MPWRYCYIAVQAVLSFVIEATRKRCVWCGEPIRGNGKYCQRCYAYRQTAVYSWCGKIISDTKRQSTGQCRSCEIKERKYRTGLRIIA